MGLGQAVTGGRLAIGVGCRAGCPAGAVVALVERAWAVAGRDRPATLFTVEDKAGEPGLAEAACAMGLALAGLPRAALAAVAGATVTPSAASATRFGLPSIAEAAALAGAGPGARLMVPRLAADGATCAVAGAGEEVP